MYAKIIDVNASNKTIINITVKTTLLTIIVISFCASVHKQYVSPLFEVYLKSFLLKMKFMSTAFRNKFALIFRQVYCGKNSCKDLSK